MRADLHSHTNASDGTLTPFALVQRAIERKLTHLAVTDHDTVEALAEARTVAGTQLTIVPGMEASCEFHGREIHVLGHFFDPAAPTILAWQSSRRAERRTRIEETVARLQKDGIRVTMEEVEAEAGGPTLTRPHIARVLVRKGYVRTFQAAFDRYLSDEIAKRRRPSPPVESAIAAIRAAGGTTSVAHPGVNGLSRQELKDLAVLGLDAVEAHHADHPPTQVDAFVRWAKELNLHVTGGSDFHSPPERKEDVEVGCRLAPPVEFEQLRALAAIRAKG